MKHLRENFVPFNARLHDGAAFSGASKKPLPVRA
jgi:hypothetical protein